MDFKKTNEKCILAFLTDDDMVSFGLTYDELDYCNEKTRLALKDIMSRAKTETDFSFCSRLRIDVMPGENDGCLILFTEIDGLEEAGLPDEQTVFECDNFNNAVDCALVLQSLGLSVPESSFYGDESFFCLIVKGADERTISLISEFMEICPGDALNAARTREAMKCLIEKDALKILCGKSTKA